MSIRVIVVSGPTASGKTALGIELAKRLNGAIISADSRMVYRGLDIGTGKPTWEHRTLDQSPWIEPRTSKLGPVYSVAGIDHYGLDLVEPEVRFTLTDWLAFARPMIANLESRGIRPIVVGGTGLYLKALIGGFEPPPTDPELRAKLESLTDDELLDRLYEHDPVSVSRVMSNRRRLVRAVEAFYLTGRPISNPRNQASIAALVIAPQVDRAELYRRIDRRLHERFAAGLIDEVQKLIGEMARGHERGQRVEWLQSLGLEYRFITDWLSQPSDLVLQTWSVELGLSTMKIQLVGAIHRYARCQLTYLRHQLPVHWVRSAEESLTVIRMA